MTPYLPSMRARLRRQGRWLAALSVPVAMLAVAGGTTSPQLIFPEGAALAFGVIGLRIDEWCCSPTALVALPTAAAGLGVALAHAGGPRWAREVVALSAALILLRAFRSLLTPTISAAVLPIVFDVRAWSFPAAVAAICALLALYRIRILPSSANSPATAGPAPVPTIVGWALIAAWIVLAGPVLALPAAALAPPLFVATFEWLLRSDRTAAVGARQWAVTVAAAALGVTLAGAVTPTWVGGVLAVTLSLAMLAATSTPHPPALAVSLIPQIAGSGHPARFVAAVAVGAGALYLGASCAHRVTIGPLARRARRDDRTGGS